MPETNYVGTPETEQVIGLAQSKLVASVKQYEAAMQQVQKLPELLQGYTLQIAAAEGKLVKLANDYKEQERTFHVELELKKKQSIKAIVTQYLQTENESSIKTTELNQLKQDLLKAIADKDQEIKAAVGKAEGIAANSHKRDLEVREAQYAQKEAENKATINSLTSQITMINNELNSWKKQLDDERKASIERSKSNAIGAVNVTGAGK